MSIFVLLLYSGYAVGKVTVRRGPQYRYQEPGVDRVTDEPVGGPR